ncbi:5857_t:CDS:1, partial [Gigaspora rosea]
ASPSGETSADITEQKGAETSPNQGENLPTDASSPQGIKKKRILL